MPPEPEKKQKARIVLCPECDAEVKIDETDDCPNCGINVQLILDKHRYNKALAKLSEREQNEGAGAKGGKKKKGDWNPLA